MVDMNKKEILHWANKYDKVNPDWNVKEKELGDRFREIKEMTKDDLIEINEWKFKKTNPDRWIENLPRVRNNSDSDVRDISRNVFSEIKSDKDKTDALDNLNGVGTSIASVILTFYNPKEYCVFDWRVWQELFGDVPENLYLTENYLKVLEELRNQAVEYNLNVRTIEKAYWTKSKYKDKI